MIVIFLWLFLENVQASHDICKWRSQLVRSVSNETGLLLLKLFLSCNVVGNSYRSTHARRNLCETPRSQDKGKDTSVVDAETSLAVPGVVWFERVVRHDRYVGCQVIALEHSSRLSNKLRRRID